MLAVTAVSGALALSVGRGMGGSAVTTAAVLAGQLFVGWNNDYLDRESDARAGRRDKPVATGEIRPGLVRNASWAALLAAIGLSLLSGGAAAFAHFAALAMASLYNLGLKRTPVSIVPYAVAFALLPAFITLGPPVSHPPPAWMTSAGALIGSGAHFTQVLPDIAADRLQGSRGLPQLAGGRLSPLLAAALLAVAVLVVAFGPSRTPAPPALAASAVALAAVAGSLAAAFTARPRLAFRLTLLTLPALLVAYIWR